MKVVLHSDLEKVGNRGDIVEVADGYARNFLIPRGFAVKATRGVEAQAQAMRVARDKADAKARQDAQKLASDLLDACIKVYEKVGAEGKLFGSVTNHEIAIALHEQYNVEVDRRNIELQEHIKEVGTYEVALKLHKDVKISLKVEVAGE